MKKYLVSLTLMFTIASSVIAGYDPASEEKAKENFKKEFTGAESVVWKESGDYYKVSFVFRGNPVEAYFNAEGELEGSARIVQMHELPLNIQTSFTKRFDNADVLDVLEVNNTEGTSYRFTFKQNDKKYQVRLDNNGNISSKEKVKG